MNTMIRTLPCPCDNEKNYSECCSAYLDEGKFAPSAETLMRSRYTAYVLQRDDYLMKTWHPETRPINLNLITDQSKWLGLTVKRSEQTAPDQAIVEFIARYKVNGKAQRLHEISRFKRIDKQWYYLDGDIL
ncbi:MAG TPA: YchJ family metal-binding protein [Nitrosomonas sp.]|nr:YchJ family metal-binding protein [Nitrosomonas sp.]HMW20245.1 YchJ family metal-binding protein [Nitrosomonas sp.]HMW68605.1 YchJ family metal-binding protein [Nitrosomonas sp.]HMY61644.1 YchJ family metal-binding protein [Nitrosomonas sp.]HMY91147.1 YchJ family metal-binding protein [Nitrosomonas sp.]